MWIEGHQSLGAAIRESEIKSSLESDLARAPLGSFPELGAGSIQCYDYGPGCLAHRGPGGSIPGHEEAQFGFGAEVELRHEICREWSNAKVLGAQALLGLLYH